MRALPVVIMGVVLASPLLMAIVSSRRRSPALEHRQLLPTDMVEEGFAPPPGGTLPAALEAPHVGTASGARPSLRPIVANKTAVSAATLAAAIPPPAVRGRRPLLSAPLWKPTVGEAPWYFPGARGASTRAREQLSMRASSGFLPRDSPLPPARGTALQRPVLTGTSWHWGQGGCERHGCSGRGVCVPRTGRCDCGPYAWGARCSIPVVTQKICVYNDSRPWFCDKPACVTSRTEMVAAAPGEVAAKGIHAYIWHVARTSTLHMRQAEMVAAAPGDTLTLTLNP